jgi:hypothetical protein
VCGCVEALGDRQGRELVLKGAVVKSQLTRPPENKQSLFEPKRSTGGGDNVIQAVSIMSRKHRETRSRTGVCEELLGWALNTTLDERIRREIFQRQTTTAKAQDVQVWLTTPS